MEENKPVRREDPLEKYERTHASRSNGDSLRNVMMVLAVVAAALAAGLIYVLVSNKKLVGDLNLEKNDLTEQIQALQSDYENLSSEYDYINSQLDSSREEIAMLVDKVKKTEATDRSKIRQYEKELGTLRSIMRNYIVQIDSLNTLNHKLTAEAAAARKDAAESKRLNQELSQQVENLSGRVSAGSVLKARALRAEALTSADKVTDRSTKVARLLISLSLVENELAEKGGVRVYVRVKDPNGNLLSDGHGTTFAFGEQTLDATASREVDYEGSEVDLGIYVNNIATFDKGIYTVEAYTSQTLLGTAELLLR